MSNYKDPVQKCSGFFVCLFVFLIQWIFLGDLRSAIIVSANIPVALFFSIMILVMLGESANLLSVGAVDFGIIVDSAVILVENIFRNFQKSELEQRRLIGQDLEFNDQSISTRQAQGSWRNDRARRMYARGEAGQARRRHFAGEVPSRKAWKKIARPFPFRFLFVGS